jgi:deoxyribodipyrimidine photo-lyase
VTGPAIVWLRDDLRVADNPALTAGANHDGELVVVVVLDEISEGVRPLGAASKWWLHHSLTALGAELERLGATLTLRRGSAREVIPALVREVAASAVFWNRRYGAAREVDAEIKTELGEADVAATSFQANLLFEPWTVTAASGEPFKVFTPFWKACLNAPAPRDPLPAPASLDGLRGVSSDDLADWELLPTTPDWAGGMREKWVPGEARGRELLDGFVEHNLERYHQRDVPGLQVASGLSPYIRWGEVSPFQIWQRLHGPMSPGARRNAEKFLSELGWREFNHSILFGHPELSSVNYRRQFDAFPWHDVGKHTAEFEAWTRGRTGIPLVDAGMRELWVTGYMHNRVRLVTSSFLIKNLLLDWRLGERWFWDTLVDADEANNAGNWQWIAGSGADAAPYFRVFNPVLQQEKFDPSLEYVRRWIPEYGTEEYPRPIVDLKQSRAEALAAYDVVKNA